MSRPPYHVLFLCTGNSARSLIAEALLSRRAAGRFVAHSAGSHPAGRPHPLALETLRRFGLATEGLRSKSWDEFAGPDAPTMDFVFTVCDDARNETCPVWPGQPVTAHWGVEDPAAFVGADEAALRVFRRTYVELERRIDLFTALPLASLDRLALQRELDGIGKSSGAPER